ncbi:MULTISPECIES: MobF family relaxase [Acidithiobacillus]|jgi:conjugative relaxase-like TrwC/TraI family protein|uniref:TrwC relaxase domain-containing protein n=2 Tax=Acidithiobacillus TaxID=119977 RepID=A0A179BKN9_ACIFR|nr:MULTISPECIES: MobF family relaxase [Acidithiobacillus]MEB8487563.1 relaxase domain-containing protein [Acidithiobacillus ferriphilus]MEB8491251.1 relaxase domain-containing protein [Acidithiobacillus ferriphilus]MEB8492332.1 relaxase domain-containing protein [Acidithiobacillus ferriphilus]MEB8514491.1 relaxase domain-containing protein [Acidithiobacillus ferriphilus]MEB8520708.1 relaxase domain-containing protein [Acidithiobacillus ferriphilus]
MLSIHAKKGSSLGHVAQVADYPDESAVLKPGQTDRPDRSDGAIEDYYSQNNGGTPSVWVGAGADALGLEGLSVQREEMLALLQGFHPGSGDALLKNAGPDRRYGYDLTFSAPKSVSVTWAIADRAIKDAISAAHDAAVADTLRHLESHLPIARRGHAGESRETASLIAGVYRHASSREQDPQMHSHALLMNIAQRRDGSWGAIESWEIYRHKMALGAIYRALLAHRLRQLGFGIEADRDSFRIIGFSEDVEREFSRRRSQIEAILQKKGRTDARSAALASLDSRKRKEIIDRAILAADWRERAAQYGLDAQIIEALRQGLVAASYDRGAVLSALTAQDSTFEERHIWQQVAIAAQTCSMGYDEICAEVAALQRDAEILRLRVEAPQRFTTREMHAIEERMVADARALGEIRTHVLDEATVQTAIQKVDRNAQQKGFFLSEEQKAAIRHVTERAGALQMIQGGAGAGKTTMLEAARMAWESRGFRVHGAAVARKAAHALFHGAGVESTSLAALLQSLEPSVDEGGDTRLPSRTLDAKDIIVVDEAGMVGSRTLQRLIGHVKASGAKLVLVGDVNQLQAIEAGGAFKALQDHSGAGHAALKENVRQKTAEMRAVVAHTLRGEAAKALEILEHKGLVEIQEDWHEAAEAAVGHWLDRYDPDRPQESLLLAATNSAVDILNDLARARMAERGRLDLHQAMPITVRDRHGKSLGQREIAIGERLVFRHNRNYAQITNNETGTVTKLAQGPHGPEITVRKDDDMEIVLTPEAPVPQGRVERQVAPGAGYAQFDYAYAGTTHRNQGTTADYVTVFADGSLESREKAYVDLSRMRHATAVVFTQPDIENDLAALGVENEVTGMEAIQAIIKAMSTSRLKDTSLDYEMHGDADQSRRRQSPKRKPYDRNRP